MIKQKLKKTGERIYCPHCCVVEYRKRYPLASVKHWWGRRVERVEEEYLYSTPKNEYPEELDNERGDVFCGTCKSLLGWIMKERTKKEKAKWKKKN